MAAYAENDVYGTTNRDVSRHEGFHYICTGRSKPVTAPLVDKNSNPNDRRDDGKEGTEAVAGQRGPMAFRQ